MNHTSHSDHSFSQPSHFAFGVLPVVLAAGLAFVQDSTSSPLTRFAMFALLIFGLSAGIWVLTIAKRFD